MRKPKMPSLASIRENKFSLKLEGLKHLPNNDIVRRIDSKLFSLDANRLYHYKPDVLAADEYARCLSLFERKLPDFYNRRTYEAIERVQGQMEQLMTTIFVKEAKHHEELQEIAVDIVREMFDIPDHVNIMPEISLNMESGPDSSEQDDDPTAALSLSEEERREMRDEIQKRIILNGLVHGSAMHIWKSAHYIVKEKVDAIDGTLMHLYDQYAASIGWILWQMNSEDAQDEISEGAMTQGSNTLEFEEPGEAECNIKCHGINFPVLLHEITKGAIDYLICHGIPSEYTEEQLKYYYAKADSYENEFWHYLLSPTVWIKLVEAADVTTQEMALIIARLTKLDYKTLADVMCACIDSQESGNKLLREKRII